jgi:hypothetical protein
MRLGKDLLSFLHPEQRRTAGSIPVSSSSAVAADTVSTKETELFQFLRESETRQHFEDREAEQFRGRRTIRRNRDSKADVCANS